MQLATAILRKVRNLSEKVIGSILDLIMGEAIEQSGDLQPFHYCSFHLSSFLPTATATGVHDVSEAIKICIDPAGYSRDGHISATNLSHDIRQNNWEDTTVFQPGDKKIRVPSSPGNHYVHRPIWSDSRHYHRTGSVNP